MNYIILCGGDGKRWNNYCDVPKHLVPLKEETLYDRTIKQILKRKNPEDKIYSVVKDTSDKRYKRKNVKLVERYDIPEYNDINKLYSSLQYINENERNIILFGDVFFSDECMDIIHSNNPYKITFYGRDFTWGKRRSEIFAISVEGSNKKQYEEKIMESASYKIPTDKRIPGGWLLYSRIHGYDIPTKMRVGPKMNIVIETTTGKLYDDFIIVDDDTEDFDYPGDYERFMAEKYGIYTKKAHP
jgi:hypothetical protein